MMLDRPFLRQGDRGTAFTSHAGPEVALPRSKGGPGVLWTFFVEGPRWTLLGLVMVAPWIYGATRPWAKAGLARALLALALWYITGLAVTRRLPRVHIAPVLLTCALLLQGWGMCWNAKQRFWPAVFAFTSIPCAVPWLPGVVDRQIVQDHLVLITGLFGAFWIASEVAAQARWQNRFYLAIALNGAGLATLGLAQRLSGAGGIFWGLPVGTEITSFFATFRYHANAGAFLNLTLPFLAFKAAPTFQTRECLSRTRFQGEWFGSSTPPFAGTRPQQVQEFLARVFWPLAALATAAAGFVNVSKGAMSVEVLLLAALLTCWLSGCTDARRLGRRELVLGGIFAALLIELIWGFGFEDSWRRWQALVCAPASDTRLLVDKIVAQRALPVAGAWGFGAGTFRIVFPFFTGPWGDRVDGVWEYAHEDYLQTLVEWGYVGGLLWAVFFLGGWVTGVVRSVQRGASWPKATRRFCLACLLSVAGVVLHAMIDFPLQIASIALYTAVLLAFIWHLPRGTVVRENRQVHSQPEHVTRFSV